MDVQISTDTSQPTVSKSSTGSSLVQEEGRGYSRTGGQDPLERLTKVTITR